MYKRLKRKTRKQVNKYVQNGEKQAMMGLREHKGARLFLPTGKIVRKIVLRAAKKKLSS